MRIHPSHRPALLRTSIVLAVMAAGAIASALLPDMTQARGIANYLPLHTGLETAALVMAALVFAVSWRAEGPDLPRNIVVIGCAFLAVAMLDFSHMLSYAGMPDFVTPSGAEKAIDFWLAGRLIVAVTLLVVAATVWRPFAVPSRRRLLLALFLLVAVAAHVLILRYPELVPRTFVVGSGLTPFKIYSEYVIITLDLAAAVLFLRALRRPLQYNGVALLGAVCAMAMSEFMLTLYADVTDVDNLLGHVYKLVAYLFIYRAIFVSTVQRPYHRLRRSQATLQATLDALPDLFFELDLDGRLYDFNPPCLELLGLPAEALTGRTVREVLPADAAEAVMTGVAEAHTRGWSRGLQYSITVPAGQTWFELSVARKAEEPGTGQRYVVLSRDIAVRKVAEHEAQRLAMLYAALSRCNEAIVRSSSMAELLPLICRDVVEFGGMRTAWIGQHDETATSYQLVAAYGSGAEVLLDLPPTPVGQGASARYEAAARAIEADRPFWYQELGDDPSTSAWDKDAERFGWGSAAVLPLHLNGRVVGTFNLCAQESGAFDEQVRGLLIEMAMDIDFALHNVDREQVRRRSEAELADSRNLLKTVVDTAPLRIFWKDLDLRYVGCNPAFARDHGLTDPRDVIGKTDFQLVQTPEADRYRDDDHEVIDTGVPKLSYDEPWTLPDGTVQWLRTSKVPLLDRVGAPAGVLGIYEDITDRKRAELALLRSETALNVAQSIAQVGSWSYDHRTGVLDGSLELRRMFGIADSGMLDRTTIADAMHPADRAGSLELVGHGGSFEHEFRIVVDGQLRWINARLKTTVDEHGDPLTTLGTAQDITTRKLFEDRIYDLAHFDALTGLPNRVQLEAQLAEALAARAQSGSGIALMFLDLDRFKDVNDALGHAVGDALLVQLADRLRVALREVDVVCRLGGDEFIVMAPDTDPVEAAGLAERLLDVIAEPYTVEDYDLNLTGSIGIAVSPADGTQLGELLRNADTAMYSAKQAGRSCVRLFTPQMQESSARNLQLVNDLRHALARGQLSLVYQPQIAMKGGDLIGVEALLRWQHPELGAVSPSEFIPIAEDSGLIMQIGEWVIRQSVRQLRSWTEAGIAPMVMAVNLSAAQFRHSDLPDTISRILREEDVAPEHLELELTEGVAMHDPEAAVAVMRNLHERGIRLSLDDFGTGYSSLSYLKEFEVYKLKLDRSFIRDVGTDAETRAIVTTILDIATSLRLKTIAEGVETAEQLAFLREQGCDEVQGFYFSRPLSADRLAAFARARAGAA